MTMYKYSFQTLGKNTKKNKKTTPKYIKESYITARNDPRLWRNHANVRSMEDYAEHITGKVLDIGCNHGASTYWLRLFDNVTEVHGIDLNRESLKHAKYNFSHFDRPFKFHCMNLVESKLDEKFDTITSFHILEHIFKEDVDSFLRNSYEMLNENGYLIIGIPYERAYPDKCHVTFWNESSLSRAMEKAGFTTIECFKDDRFAEKNILTGLFKKV